MRDLSTLALRASDTCRSPSDVQRLVREETASYLHTFENLTEDHARTLALRNLRFGIDAHLVGDLHARLAALVDTAYPGTGPAPPVVVAQVSGSGVSGDAGTQR